ncbi:ABC transporter [Corynebacterium maris DSM 45190]|uniref:ABC transporter n=1 Tax=Corynebacterium maris DSM 45190 TaxID=1224163 RepID=S5TLL1_9CORY|nr:ABC transporter [Corynebacterium maris]AGS35766.1 ABC transporter [Corynebacterium maris DSM 45190]
MTVHHTLLSEWTKLRTTASFWWTTGLVLVLSIGWAALTTWSLTLLSGDLGGPGAAVVGPMITPDIVLTGFTSFGILIIMIQAAMTVTTEYRYGLPSISFLATPRRGQVALAKALLYAALAAVISGAAAAGAYVVALGVLAGDSPGVFTPFSDPAGQRALWAVPLAMFVLVFLCQGVGMLVRQSAGAIFLLVLWNLVFETAVRLLPRWGEDIHTVLPFVNMDAVIQNTPVYGAEWGVWGSLLIFVAWSLAVWLVGVFALRARDA